MAKGTRLDVIELSLRQIQKEVSLSREENVATTRERLQVLDRRITKHHTNVNQRLDEINQRMDGTMRISSALLPNRLLEDFSPRTKVASVLAEVGILPLAPVLQGVEGCNEMEPDIQGRGFIPNHHHTPVPRLEIPIFEGDKPRWWIRRCERFFTCYQVVESQKVNLAATYLNDMVDAWFQGWSRLRNNFN